MSATTSILNRTHAAALTARRLAEAKRRLESTRSDLMSTARAPHEPSSILDEPPQPGEFAAESAIRDLEFRRRETRLQRLARIEDALERLCVGDYGICATCENGIGWRRLDLDPAAQRCIACEEASETNLRTPSL